MNSWDWYSDIEDRHYTFSDNTDMLVYVGKIWDNKGFYKESREFGSKKEAHNWNEINLFLQAE